MNPNQIYGVQSNDVIYSQHAYPQTGFQNPQMGPPYPQQGYFIPTQFIYVPDAMAELAN